MTLREQDRIDELEEAIRKAQTELVALGQNSSVPFKTLAAVVIPPETMATDDFFTTRCATCNEIFGVHILATDPVTLAGKLECPKADHIAG